MFDWKWYLKDIKQDKQAVKVFTCFSCGGGSSMGYKRAGFDVVGNVEIDPKINQMYVKNHHPRHNYNMDIRDFNKLENLPEELYKLDILDGSPPCTVFSMAGQREATWGKKKKFREGQKAQMLDDLFFVWLDTVERLKPKIAIAENVTGLIRGNAKGYVNMILKRFKEIGYDVQLFKLNAAFMDVPQTRERVFFIANRMGYPKLKLNFHGKPIKFGEVRTERGKPLGKAASKARERLKHLKANDRAISDITERTEQREVCFNDIIYQDHYVAGTLTASGSFYRACDKSYVTDGDMRNISSFPQEYDFCGNSVQFVCGMSVPPNMTANIAAEIWRQWINN